MPKDAYYFSHDSNARTDPKIMAMMKAYGIEGYGRFWIIVESLSEQSDYKMELCEWSIDALAMAMLCETDSAKKFVNDCISRFSLLKSDGAFFWSESLCRRMKVKEESRLKRVEAGRKGAETRWSDSNAMAKPKQTHSGAIAKDSKESKGDKVKEIYSSEFETFWNLYPRKDDKKPSYAAWQARLKEEHSPEQIIAAAKNYLAKCKADKTEHRFIKMAKTFLGPGGHIEEYIAQQPHPDPDNGEMTTEWPTALQAEFAAEIERRRQEWVK